MEISDKGLTKGFKRLEETTLKKLNEFEETTSKRLHELGETVLEMEKTTKKLMSDSLRELVDETKENLRPLLQKMENFEKFKESTVNHLVSLTKQIQQLQKEMDTVKETLSNNNNNNNGTNKSSTSMSNNSNNNCDRDDTDDVNDINDSNNTSHDQMNAKLDFLQAKVNSLEKKSAIWESKAHSTDYVADGSNINQQTAMPNELQLQERKKNNVIVFGFKENHNDKDQLKALFRDLGAKVTIDDAQMFRVGRSLERPRPLILKLKSHCEKNEILLKAKGLKDNETWRGLSVTHDLTRWQCQEEKAREMELKKLADEKNGHLSEEEKSEKVWRVVGGRGTRRLMLKEI